MVDFNSYYNNRAATMPQDSDESMDMPLPQQIDFVDILSSVVQFHLWHFASASFDEHLIIGDFYDKIDDLSDTLLEAYFESFGINVESYSFDLSCGYDLTAVMDRLEGLKATVESNLELTEDETYASIYDSLVQIHKLIVSTLYKLKIVLNANINDDTQD